jgi:hypothetical protein
MYEIDFKAVTTLVIAAGSRRLIRTSYVGTYLTHEVSHEVQTHAAFNMDQCQDMQPYKANAKYPKRDKGGDRSEVTDVRFAGRVESYD